MENKGYQCRVERDSVSFWGQRITTFVIRVPRIILAEINTHRALSKSTASSRAIPIERMIKNIREDPFIPINLYHNQSGMQAHSSPLTPEENESFRFKARNHLEDIIEFVEGCIKEENIHKQWLNRYLEPFAWCTQIITGTDWANFFALRCHKDAQPEFQKIARMMWDAYSESIPSQIDFGFYHLPFTKPNDYIEFDLQELKYISAGRSARVSYDTHDGIRDPKKDLDLAYKLGKSHPLHATPFEHIATPAFIPWKRSGNFKGWIPMRKELRNETIYTFGGY